MAYGFTIHVDQNVVKTMKDIENAMNHMNSTVSNATHSAERRMEQMGETAHKVGRYIAEAFAIREIFHFGKEILELTAEFEGFQNVIKFSSKNSYDAGQNLEFIEDVVKRLHLPIKEAMQGFSEMQAGLIGTGVEGENLRKVFEGISTAGAVLHLPAKNLEMILYDFKELGERGLNMRNWMSLQGWFPGIGNVVRQTFGKSFHEIQQLKGTDKEITPGDFLTKLGEGMTKYFQGGVPNAGNALISQMNDTKNAMIKAGLELGENLRPVFTEIMHQMRAVFDSGIVKMFISNAKPLVELIITLGKAWLIYKAGILAANIALQAYTQVMAVVETAQTLNMVQMSKMEFLLTKIESIPMGTVWGAFALRLSFVASEAQKVNDQFEKTMENFSHLKELTGSQDQFSNQFDRISNFFNNQEAHTPEEKAMMLQNINTLLPQVQQHGGVIADQIKASQTALKNHKGYEPSKFFQIKPGTPMEDAIKQEKELQKTNMAMVKGLEDMKKSLEKQGVKPYKQIMPNPESNTKDASLKTMGLAGAKGGLGEAKNVNIHIGTLQKVDVKTPAAIKQAAQDGVEVLLRALNNMAYGRSSTM